MAKLQEVLQLDRPAVVNVIERFELGSVPSVLLDGAEWLDPNEQAVVNATVDNLLADAGATNGDGLRHRVEDALIALARPEVAVWAWIQHRHAGPSRLMLGRNGRDAAMLVVRADDFVRFTGADHDRLGVEFVSGLPDLTPGLGRSFTFPTSEAPWKWKNRDGLLADGRHAREQAQLAAEEINAPRDGAAQIYIAVNEMRFLPLYVMWIQGFGMWTVATDDGEEAGADPWVTVAPSSADALAELIDRKID